MRPSKLQPVVKSVLLSLALALLSAIISPAQVVNLTATRQTTTLPDGKIVPMWGWVCGTGPNAATSGATCTAMNGQQQTPGATALTPGPWQPPLIVLSLPPGSAATTSSVTIKLANALPVETSLVVMGQLPGGGLGAPVREATPRNHPEQTETTWTQTFRRRSCPRRKDSASAPLHRKSRRILQPQFPTPEPR